MSREKPSNHRGKTLKQQQRVQKPTLNVIYSKTPLPPIPNYTLSTVCPACGAPTYRRACKVGCDQCGFVWDCGEL